MLHQGLSQEKWNTITFVDQMANIGTDVGRAINWSHKDADKSRAACDRALELLDLTISDPKNKGRLKELCRVQEVVAGYFYSSETYGYTVQALDSYFIYFANASAAVRGF